MIGMKSYKLGFMNWATFVFFLGVKENESLDWRMGSMRAQRLSGGGSMDGRVHCPFFRGQVGFTTVATESVQSTQSMWDISSSSVRFQFHPCTAGWVTFPSAF